MGLRCLGLIPARGGSKGIPGKNLRPLAGKPLLVYTIEAALASRWLDRVVVSTDDARIRGVALQAGAEAPFLRPAELAQDDTPMWPVVKHALSWLVEHGYRPDVLVLLQPTSPLRQSEDIDRAVELLVSSGADVVTTVTPVREHPYLMRKLEGNRLTPLFPVPLGTSLRQEYPPVYRLNGAVYAMRAEVVEREDPLSGDVRGIVMDRRRSVDIDEQEDLVWAEWLMMQQAF